jgi:ABC-type nitrate/sulfonate/bicarbonate transport system permease component
MARLKLHGLRALCLAGLAALWEVVVRLGWTDPVFVPAPSAVAAALGPTFLEALPALGETLSKALVAYLMATALGVGLGLVIGSIRYLYDVVNPFLVVLYSVPKILVLPWIMLLTGTGTTPAVLYGTLHGFFPVALLAIGGVRDIDRHLVTVARSMGATAGQIYRKVVLPAALPAVLEGLRLGIVFCLLGVLIVEMFAGIRGMGYLLQALGNGFRAAELFAATLIVSAMSVAIVLALAAASERLGRWR